MDVFAVRLNSDPRKGRSYSAYPTQAQYRKIHGNAVGNGFHEAVNFLAEGGYVRGYLPPKYSREIRELSSFTLVTMTYKGDQQIPNAIIGIQVGCRHIEESIRQNPNGGPEFYSHFICDEVTSLLLDKPINGAYEKLFGRTGNWLRHPTKRVDEAMFYELLDELGNSNDRDSRVGDFLGVLMNFDGYASRKIRSAQTGDLSNATGRERPRRFAVTTTVYERDQKVAALALRRANGICDDCKNPAPFLRRRDDTPFLEVHHRITLSDGGPDTPENTIAICPNCHRKRHYG
jgi:HNH endonuclease